MMARGGPLTSSAAVLLFAALAALLYTAELPRAVVVWGIWRPRAKTAISNAADFRVIADTVHCEDVQYHESSNLLFTACEGTEATRFAWFPPLARFGDPTAALKAQGALEVVDPAVSYSRCSELPSRLLWCMHTTCPACMYASQHIRELFFRHVYTLCGMPACFAAARV